MPAPISTPLDPADQSLVAGVLARQLRPLAKAITLIESQREDHQARAQKVLEALLPHTGGAMRVGISGVPGVGKSTFIEALGLYLIEQGLRVAVLAVDPSSSVTGGSILGDKTSSVKNSPPRPARKACCRRAGVSPCPPRRNGSWPAGRAPPRRFTPAKTWSRRKGRTRGWRKSPGITPTRTRKPRLRD